MRYGGQYVNDQKDGFGSFSLSLCGCHGFGKLPRFLQLEAGQMDASSKPRSTSRCFMNEITDKWNNRIHEYKRFSMIQQWMIVHLFSIQSFYVCFFQVRRVLERWKTTWPWGVHNYRRSLGLKWQWNVALKSLSLRMVLARLHNGRMVAGIRLVQSAIQKARF